MENSSDISAVVHSALRVRITKVLPAQIRICLADLTDEQLWWRPNEQSNSIGNLTLHVCGAVMHFLCRGVGGLEYSRDRPAEFAATSMPKEQLLGILDDTFKKAERTFAELDLHRLGDPSTEPTYYSSIFEDLFGIAIHIATHTGQIVYVTKALNEGSVNDLWSKTHKSQGAWRS